MVEKYYFTIYLLLGLLITGVVPKGLKGVRVVVPRYRIPGEMAQLQCEYDLGEDLLYAVKWYKENEEFYRFVPKARPQATKYDVDGVSVDLNLSNSKNVVLSKVNLKSSGVYRCEVNAEAPSFASSESQARMDVVLLPSEDPVITDGGRRYQIGDQIRLNCTSGKSFPASVLDWYINEQLVKNDNALIQYETQKHDKGLESSILGLKFILDDRHFIGGSMRIKCVASVSAMLWKGDRESVVHSAPHEELREALLLVKSASVRVGVCSWTVLAIVIHFVT